MTESASKRSAIRIAAIQATPVILDARLPSKACGPLGEAARPRHPARGAAGVLRAAFARVGEAPAPDGPQVCRRATRERRSLSRTSLVRNARIAGSASV
jgi:hypothetical protein